MREGGRGQGSGGSPGARMRHHAGGLVYHEDVVVLEYDREGNRLGRHLHRGRGRHMSIDPLARPQSVRHLDPPPIDQHMTGLDDDLDPRSGETRKPPAEPDIQPGARLRSGDGIAEVPRPEGRGGPALHCAGGAAGQSMRKASRITPTLMAESATLKAGQ